MPGVAHFICALEEGAHRAQDAAPLVAAQAMVVSDFEPLIPPPTASDRGSPGAVPAVARSPRRGRRYQSPILEPRIACLALDPTSIFRRSDFG